MANNRQHTDDSYLHVSNLKLSYPLTDGKRLTVLDIDKFTIDRGSSVGLMGPSGSGKTSFLYSISGIERPQEGEIRWGDVMLNKLSPIEIDRWRQRNIGFVFQDFHLIPRHTPLENVLLPVYFQHMRPTEQIKSHAQYLLNRVGISNSNVSVERLSRGEKQRVATARALLMSPPIILADEPTASIDRETAEAVMELLLSLSVETGATLFVVSHDPAIMNHLSQVYSLSGGRLIKEEDTNV